MNQELEEDYREAAYKYNELRLAEVSLENEHKVIYNDILKTVIVAEKTKLLAFMNTKKRGDIK